MWGLQPEWLHRKASFRIKVNAALVGVVTESNSGWDLLKFLG